MPGIKRSKGLTTRNAGDENGVPFSNNPEIDPELKSLRQPLEFFVVGPLSDTHELIARVQVRRGDVVLVAPYPPT